MPPSTCFAPAARDVAGGGAPKLHRLLAIVSSVEDAVDRGLFLDRGGRTGY